MLLLGRGRGTRLPDDRTVFSAEGLVIVHISVSGPFLPGKHSGKYQFIIEVEVPPIIEACPLEADG